MLRLRTKSRLTSEACTYVTFVDAVASHLSSTKPAEMPRCRRRPCAPRAASPFFKSEPAAASRCRRKNFSCIPRATAFVGLYPLPGWRGTAAAEAMRRRCFSGGSLPITLSQGLAACQEHPPNPSFVPSVAGPSKLTSGNVAELAALVERFEGQAPPHVVEWMRQTVRTLEVDRRERDALMKRSWSDTPFEDGEDANERTIEGFELELVGMLQNSRNGLGDAEILGNAIDLAGAYKKNYKLDKSEAVLLRCTRAAEERGGAWHVKYLNHMSQVRMKQARNAEALEMMYEMESLAPFDVTEPGASTFYETLYRNMSCALRSLGREDEAALYFTKMVQAARHHKSSLDWMDLWELGILMANRAYQSEKWPEFYKSRDILAEALRLQKKVEPNELILRAKVLSNLGQCYLATGEYEQADVYYSEAYDLFNQTVGKRSPLFGMQAWACGNLRFAERKYAASLPLLGEALYVEVVGDGLSVPEMNKLVDQILVALNSCREQGGIEEATALGNLFPIQRALATLVEDPRWAELDETLELGVLSHRMALISVSSQSANAEERRCASTLSRRGLDILRRLAIGRGAGSQAVAEEARRQAMQAEMVHQAFFERQGAAL